MRISACLLNFSKISDKKKEYFARKLIGFSSMQMYKVVADVRNYKKFVPFCTESTIVSEEPHELRANLEVGFPPIVENYTSVVSLLDGRSVKALCRDGHLFTVLETSWRFSPGLRTNRQTCIVDFHINFEFKSLLYSQVATLFFNQLVQQMENAFIEEARRRYGAEALPVHELETTS